MVQRILFVLALFVGVNVGAQTSITACPDTIICPTSGCANLYASYVMAGGGGATSYAITDIAYAPDAYAGTAVGLSDDSQSGMFPIGFTFCYYGNTYTNFVICSNGWIGFTAGMTSSWVTTTVPTVGAGTPRNCIMGPWQDINPSVGGQIRYQLLGVAPFRRLVVSYINVPMYSCTGLLATQQIIIYESTNIIENHIQNKPLCAGWNGGNATQALHNLPGTLATIYPGRNNTNWTFANQAIRYTPSGLPTIEWYDGAILLGTGSPLLPMPCPAVTTTYTVNLVACGTGVVATDDVVVTVSCCDVPDLDSTDVTCNGACDGTATAFGDGTSPFTYLWDDPLAQTTMTAVGLCAGVYTCEVTDVTGCMDLNTIIVNEPPVLVLNLNSFANELCEMADGQIDVSAAGGTPPYQYSIDGGTTWVGSGVFTGLIGGAYTLTVEDANGCQATVNVVLTGDPAITVGETITNETCQGDCDGVIDLVGATGPLPYIYSIDGCATPSASGLYASLCPGVYNICVEDANGCQYTNVVNIIAGPIVGDATITPIGPYCRDFAPVALNAVTPGGIWSGTGVVGGTFSPSIAGPGVHTITYTIPGLCGDVDTYDVTVYDLPGVAPQAPILQGCVPLTIDFFNAAAGTGTCIWDFGDGSTASSCAPISHIYTTGGSYDVTLTVTDLNGCVQSVTNTAYINAYDLPTANFTWSPMDADIQDPVVDFTDLSDLANSWTWTFGIVGGTNEQNPTFEFPKVGDYAVKLIVTSLGGCVDEITQLVSIKDIILFFIPNVFTPDGDGSNDLFKPAFTSGIDIYNFHFTILNRWGEIVWESFNPAGGWDGTYGDRGIVEDGTYVWRLEFLETMSDKKHAHHGHVTILK